MGHTIFPRWYALTELRTVIKIDRDHSRFSQFQIAASTVLIYQVPFSDLYFDRALPSLKTRITILLTMYIQTPRSVFPGLPASLSVFGNVFTHFYYPCVDSDTASFTRCRHNRRKLITYSMTLPPSWENGTCHNHSQFQYLLYSEIWPDERE